MWQKIKDSIISRKFILVVIGSAVCAGMKYFGISDEIIMIVAGFFGVNIAGVAVQDIGKK